MVGRRRAFLLGEEGIEAGRDRGGFRMDLRRGEAHEAVYPAVRLHRVEFARLPR